MTPGNVDPPMTAGDPAPERDSAASGGAPCQARDGLVSLLTLDDYRQMAREAAPFDCADAEQLANAVLALCHQVEFLQTPYCLGAATIRRVADEGQIVVGPHAFIAASDLIKQDPYARIEALEPVLEAAEDIHAVLLTTPLDELMERMLGLERAIKTAREVIGP